MRIIGAAIVVVAACGPKHAGAPARDFTLHDQLIVQFGDAGTLAYEMIDPDTGARTPLYTQANAMDELWDVAWAGRCVVYAHGEGLVDVIDPVTSKRWTLDEGNGGVAVAGSDDGVWAAWDCVGDAGPSVCVTRVDNSEDNVEVAVSPDGGPIYPLRWHGDELIYRASQTLLAIPRAGGEPRALLTLPSADVDVAPDAATVIYPDQDDYVVQPLAGGDPTRIAIGRAAKSGDCVFAGSDHLACWAGDAVRLHEVAAGSSTELAAGLTDPRDVIGDPTGAGAAYVAGEERSLWVVRGGRPPHKLAEGVFSVDDWRP